MIIYCDGIFDLYHSGHRAHFLKLKKKHPSSSLMVGVISDKDAEMYKRKPTFDEKTRELLVSSDKSVDKVLKHPPLILDKSFILNNKIDLVYHAFKNDLDKDKQSTFYKIPKEMGIFRTVGYDQNVSTTEILQGWNKIWHKKGKVDTTDLQLLSGYENTDFDPKYSWDHIKKHFDITNESILEVGSGPGYIAQYIDNTYVGIEQSYPLCEKCNKLAQKTCIQGEASNLPFKDNSFDYVICVGVLQYFPDHQYTRKAIAEMKRVAKKGVYIGSIRYKTHTKKLDKHIYTGPITHLLHSPDMFPEFEQDETFYSKSEYFNMFFQ